MSDALTNDPGPEANLGYLFRLAHQRFRAALEDALHETGLSAQEYVILSVFETRPEQAGMLLLADRNFPGYQLWGMVAATGADLLWRIKGNQVFMVVKSAGQERVVNDQLTGPHGRRPQSASDSPSAQAGPAGWPRQ
jgi:hypothetical protein